MPLTDDQWNDFLKATIRISLTPASKKRVVNDVAGTDADNDPWADFLAIHGKKEFISEIATHLRRVEDRGRIILFLTVILSYTHNDEDKATIASLIKHLETGIGSISKPIPQESRSLLTPTEPIAMRESDENPINYIDFDIDLTAYESQGEKKVAVNLDCRDSTGIQIVSLAAPCYLNSLAIPLSFNPTSEMRQPDVVGYGHQIYSKIFSGDLGTKFGEALGNKPGLIRIGISSTGTDVPNHVWELICRDKNLESFLSLDQGYSVARIVKCHTPSTLRKLVGPINILIGHASPTGTASIPVEHPKQFEQIAIDNRHTAKILPGLNFDSIKNLFETVQDEQFHVVHLICHGKFTYDSTGVLIFEGANREKQNIDPSVLAHVLKRVSPSLVILQACHSGDIESSKDFVSGVAKTLVGFGIPAVLAFRGEPQIDFAFDFLSEVYERWLPGQVPIETALQSARLTIRNSQTTSRTARPIDAWSLPVLYRQPGVFLQIVNKSSPGPGPTPDRLAVLIEYLTIILESQQEILKKIGGFLAREGLIDASIRPHGATLAELVATQLVTQRPNHLEVPVSSTLRDLLTDWKDRNLQFLDDTQKDALRSVRDTVFLASLPEEDTQEMVKAISNAIQTKASGTPSSANFKAWNKDIATLMGRYAHARLMDQRSRKTGNESFVFQLLNKKFEGDDTSIFFEDRFYRSEFIDEPIDYRKLRTPTLRKEGFAKGAWMLALLPKE
jgi:hypothetical protein